jgi:hypothetical protein
MSITQKMNKQYRRQCTIQYFFSEYLLAIEFPAIQYKAINMLKPPKTQDSHVKESITKFVKITVQRAYV